MEISLVVINFLKCNASLSTFSFQNTEIYSEE